jgi:hypothetical protein
VSPLPGLFGNLEIFPQLPLWATLFRPFGTFRSSDHCAKSSERVQEFPNQRP